MPDIVYEQWPPGGQVTLTFVTATQRLQSVAVNNPSVFVWRGTVWDPASRQADGTYTVGCTLTCPPGQTVAQTIPSGALRVRATTETIDGETFPKYEILNTATGLWETPIPYTSSLTQA